MKYTISLASLLLGVVFVILAPGSDFPVEAAAQTPGLEPDKGIEVLGHGPIHEAFAQPALPTLEMSAVVNKQPPAPVEELPPDVKPEGDNVNWVPGYWAFDNERNDFIWISGFWRNMPPNRVWVSGYWAQDGNGYRWVPGYWSEASATQVYYPPPPEVIVEAPPPAPNDSSFYVAGTWVYRDTRYLWRPGYWSPYRPGWLWTQPRYSWTPGGYIFVDGYWDYDFGRRGVLFAPAYFGPGYFAANRYYRPSFALATNFLYASLFIQPRTGFYYFGDYYAPRYAGLGYTPWIDYRYRGRYADPAWSYYAWQNRGTPRWEQQMRASYTARERGEAPAPPRRIDTQAAAPASKQTDVNVSQNVNLVMPVQQLATHTGVKLRAVPKDEIATVQRQAGEARTFAKSRQTVESNADLKASRQQAVPVKLQLPKTVPTAFKGEQPPPPPVLPKLDAQAAPPTAKDTSNAPMPPLAPKTNDPTPKSKDATPSPKVPLPPPAPPQKGKDQSPKSAPKTGVAPQAPLPPAVSPMPKATPLPPKVEPKAIPTPKTTPPTAPPPKSLPPQPKPLEPKTLPAPLPKTAPSANVLPPAPKAPPLAPNTAPPPVQKVIPPPPKTLPSAPKAPPLPAPQASPTAPKTLPPTPKVVPVPGPTLDRPSTPVRPEPSKGKGKDKEKD